MLGAQVAEALNLIASSIQVLLPLGVIHGGLEEGAVRVVLLQLANSLDQPKQFSTRQLTTVASYWSAPGLLLSPVQSILRLVLTSISIGQLQVSVVKVWNKGKIREKFPSQWINRHWLKLSEGSEGKLTTESKTIGEWDGLNNLVVGIDYWTIWL